uniref:Uncharacterized protein n=1 Tax=Euplotes crassus TaxID=5936 RepID=A0A7S3KBU2_EUPCR|mmetsp:Transcript_16761/g.16438  ORF Transcript_16761/g.16438 Transcript_16761/m.16438 type:complete len:179 (+) Transcript_16761:129-665(+)
MFLHKMGQEAKADQILQKPYNIIGQTISKIYKEDGKFLMKWITDEYSLDVNGGNRKDKSDINITSCKEKFKILLSLDIWIEKLAQWQSSGYKLEMPKREEVDSLRWDMILREKLKEALRSRGAPSAPPENKTSNQPSGAQDEMYLRAQEQRKRKYVNMPKQPATNMRDPDAYRQLKQK